ncbi:Uncharacterized protein APZ42_034281, partial [Daphnia magna]
NDSNIDHQLLEPVSSDDEFDYAPDSNIECSSSDDSIDEIHSFVWTESEDGEDYSDRDEGSPKNTEFESSLLKLLAAMEFSETEIPDVLNMLANVDGIPLSKSSSSDFWPILLKIQ